VSQIEQLTLSIRGYDTWIAKTSERYPVVERLRAIKGMGPITALTFVVTLDDPKRFRSARAAGPYLGLCPRLDQSGNTNRQLRISKAGDTELRSLLVSCAQYIMGPFGEDCDLRLYGSKIAERGGKNAKKRAVVAVARKLAVLLLALWKNNTTYEPVRQAGSSSN
jgi:transposase